MIKARIVLISGSLILPFFSSLFVAFFPNDELLSGLTQG
jgi:hypothetical protein